MTVEFVEIIAHQAALFHMCVHLQANKITYMHTYIHIYLPTPLLAGFTMGVVCAQSHEGVVGSHAYSILDVKELRDDAIILPLLGGQQRQGSRSIAQLFSQSAATVSSQQGEGAGGGGGGGNYYGHGR